MSLGTREQVAAQRAKIQGLFAKLAQERPDLIDAESAADLELFEKAYLYGWHAGCRDAESIAVDAMTDVRDVLRESSP